MAQQKCVQLNGFADTVTISYVHWWNSDTFNLGNELLNTWISETNSDPCTSSLSSESLEDPTKIERVQFVTTSPPVFSCIFPICFCQKNFFWHRKFTSSAPTCSCKILVRHSIKGSIFPRPGGASTSATMAVTQPWPAMNFNNPKAWRDSKYTCLMFWVSM